MNELLKEIEKSQEKNNLNNSEPKSWNHINT